MSIGKKRLSGSVYEDFGDNDLRLGGCALLNSLTNLGGVYSIHQTSGKLCQLLLTIGTQAAFLRCKFPFNENLIVQPGQRRDPQLHAAPLDVSAAGTDSSWPRGSAD